ncbi:hypothetical protein CERSUDRAFT_71988 [Gelatoporia subvermispora B]|uniref:Uncharacterized protein n=1 Tax=Ceriporiopsis subvermispora (strain B) TaxID=914234 RepID=M2QT45_CERS8|nr:hypothetical protein CERSUDRAFT_71988 [Gelatoporia subvermispora B]
MILDDPYARREVCTKSIAFLWSAYEDAQAFVTNAPPDSEHLSEVLTWLIILSIALRGLESKLDLHELAGNAVSRFNWAPFGGATEQPIGPEMTQDTLVGWLEHPPIATPLFEKPSPPEQPSCYSHSQISTNLIKLYRCQWWCGNPSAVLMKCGQCKNASIDFSVEGDVMQSVDSFSTLDVRSMLKLTIATLLMLEVTHYCLDHALTLLGGTTVYFPKECKDYHAVLTFLVAWLQSTNVPVRYAALAGLFRLHYQPRNRDFYTLGKALITLIIQSEYSIMGGTFEFLDERTGTYNRENIGLPFVMWVNSLPHCASALREKRIPFDLDAVDILEPKYVEMNERWSDAVILAQNAIACNPNLAYAYDAITLGEDRAEGLRVAKKGLKFTGLIIFVRNRLRWRAVDRSSGCPYYGTTHIENVAMLMSGYEDAKVFISNAPPDERNMGMILN